MNNQKFFFLVVICLSFLISCNSKKSKQLKKEYYPTGELKSYGFYIKDSISIDTIFNLLKNGKTSDIQIYNAEGSLLKSVIFYDNGNVREIKNFKRGMQAGFSYSYSENGEIYSKIFFYNGVRIGDSYFFQKNKITYNFIDWKQNNISLIGYDSDYKIVNDERKIIYIDSLRLEADTINGKNLFSQNLLIVISNPIKCKTDIIVEYFSRNNILMGKDSITNYGIFYKENTYPDSISSIRIFGTQYDSIIHKATYQQIDKHILYDN